MKVCRLAALVSQNEALSGQVKERDANIGSLTARIGALDARLSDAATVLTDKERLEEQVVRQMDAVNSQAAELDMLRDALSTRDAQMEAAHGEISELELKASKTKEHDIMFGEPWIIENSHHRLHGAQPRSREGSVLVAMHGASWFVAHCSVYYAAQVDERLWSMSA
jgi:hypothetical protein